MYKIEIESDIKLDYNANEAFKALRANIGFCGKEIKVIAATSCVPNEGKSVTTYQLAKSFAASGKKVLYIDADMRKSVFKSRFGVSARNSGLSHFLSGLAELNDVLGVTEFHGEQSDYAQMDDLNTYEVHMILAGAVPPNPSELLGNERFLQLISYGKENYDYVLIDTPPIGAVIDAAVIAKQCDGVILISKCGAISYRLAQKVTRQLRMAQCRILGVVYTMVPLATKSNNKYGYYKKGYYGSRYYSGYYGGGYYGYYGKSKDDEED